MHEDAYEALGKPLALFYEGEELAPPPVQERPSLHQVGVYLVQVEGRTAGYLYQPALGRGDVFLAPEIGQELLPPVEEGPGSGGPPIDGREPADVDRGLERREAGAHAVGLATGNELANGITGLLLGQPALDLLGQPAPRTGGSRGRANRGLWLRLPFQLVMGLVLVRVTR